MSGYGNGSISAFNVAAVVTGKDLTLQKTYTVFGTIMGSDAPGGLAASLQLKDNNGNNMGSPVTAESDGAYSINVPIGTGYTIAVNMSGYYNGTIPAFGISNTNVTANLTLQKVYTVSGTITGSDTSNGLAASLQLKDSSNNNVGSAVTAAANGSYTINAPSGTGYTIAVTMTRYYNGTIPPFDIAADVTGENLTLQKAVQTVGVGGGYSSLTAALAAAGDGDTITLLSDITESVSYTTVTGTTVTIDGQNHTITGVDGSSSAALTLSGPGTVNLKNLTLQGGTSTATPGASYGLSLNDNVSVQSEGTVNAIGGTAQFESSGVFNSSNGAVNVTTATGGSSSSSSGVYNSYFGTVNVTTATGVTYGVINESDGTVNVTTASGSVSGVSNQSAGIINVTTSTGVRDDGSNGSVNVANNTGGTTGTAQSQINTNVTTLTLNKGSGANCVLDSITVAATDSTDVGILPGVYKNGVAGVWYTDSDKTIPFNGKSVTGTTVLYSTFYSGVPPLNSAPTAAPGSVVDTTAITAVPNTSGDALAVEVSASTIATPSVGGPAPTGSGVTNPFTSGSNLAAAPGDYVGVYELDNSGVVAAYSRIQLTSADITSLSINIVKPNGCISAQYGAAGGNYNDVTSYINAAILLPGSIQIGNAAFGGNDPDPGVAKQCIITYNDSTGQPYKTITVSENDTLYFNSVPIAQNSMLSPTSATFDLYSGDTQYHKTIPVTVTPNGNTLTGITNGGYTLTSMGASPDYSVSNNVYTINTSYLDTLTVAESPVDLTFKFSAGSTETLTVTVENTTNVTPASLSITGMTMNMSGSGPSTYTATGSGANWTFTVPQDTATTLESANYTMPSVTVNMTGADTTQSPITAMAVSGPYVPPGGAAYGTLVYANNTWTLTPYRTQTFETAGTYVFQCMVKDTADTPTTVSATVNVAPTYALTITADTGGTITAGSSGNYAAGTVINLTAAANSNYSFNGWTTSNGGTFANANSVSTTFTMPSGATAITATFTSSSNKTLESITTPPAITGVANGTAKTASALGLPAAVMLVTDNGNVQANVSWDVSNSSYDLSNTAEQTFTVDGAVTLPSGVVNPNNVALTTSISVTVELQATPTNGLTFNPVSGSTVTTSTLISIAVSPALTTSDAVYWNTTGFPLTTGDHLYQDPGFSLSVPGTVYAAVYDSPTCSWSDQASAAYTIRSATVSVTGVSLDKTSDTIGVNGNDTLTATISPPGATNQSVTWKSDMPSVAKVTGSGLTCTVTGMATGTAKITVTTADGAMTATSDVTVITPPVVSTGGSGKVSNTTGGTVSAGSAASVTIPADAMGSASSTVTVQTASSPPAAPTGYTIVGAYDFKVDGGGYTFNSPVTLTFTFDPSQIPTGTTPAVYYYDNTTSKWVLVTGGTVSGDTITVTVDHFTTFGVMAAPVPVAINDAAISGVTAPVTGTTPVSTIADNGQYRATVTWPSVATTFAASTTYTATITITPDSGYTLTGVKPRSTRR